MSQGEASYQLGNYREAGTGKLIVKVNSAISDLSGELSGSPQDLEAVETAINSILAALRNAGIIPSS